VELLWKASRSRNGSGMEGGGKERGLAGGKVAAFLVGVSLKVETVKQK